jgi:cell division protein FtsN
MTVRPLLLALSVIVLIVAGCSRQQSDWQKTRESNTSEAYEAFLKKYPAGEFSAQAQARLKELYEDRDWQKARDTDTAEAYQAFIKQYPEGKNAEEARIRVENFTLAQPPATAPPAEAAATDAVAAPPKPVAAAPSASPKAAIAAPGARGGTYGVQLGAFKSSADAAHHRWDSLAAKYPKLLGGLTSKVSPKKTANGTLYRLQVVDLSEQHARALCKSLAAKSQACVILKPGHA